MKTIILLLALVNFSAIAKDKAMSFYDYTADDIDGNTIKMNQYKGKVVLIVNTASKCGYTSQFGDLEELYKKHKEKGLVILGFPCNQFMNQDPGSNKEIHEFCKLNYGVTFTMFSKIEVNGKNTHPLYQFLKKEKPGVLNTGAIKWNFTKFLVDKDGKVVERFSSGTIGKELENANKKLL